MMPKNSTGFRLDATTKPKLQTAYSQLRLQIKKLTGNDKKKLNLINIKTNTSGSIG